MGHLLAFKMAQEASNEGQLDHHSALGLAMEASIDYHCIDVEYSRSKRQCFRDPAAEACCLPRYSSPAKEVSLGRTGVSGSASIEMIL